MTSKPPAIRVIGGSKRYGNTLILDSLDMNVPSGTTYALIGSSGCGKTTLLSCIIGLRKLSAGKARIFGKSASSIKPTDFGFMPQEAGLQEEFRISEVLTYFGRIYGMQSSAIKERSEFLLKLLQLPDGSKEISELSGGEKRRCSLAVSLLHQPKLLILDEPTVGVDPLIRNSIWEHLYRIVKEEGVTVILSTHSTEEAREADLVSVMRKGKLMGEESPKQLLSRFGTNLLEDVVLQLSKSQQQDLSRKENGIRTSEELAWKSKSLGITSPINDNEPLKSTVCDWFHRQLQMIYAILILNLVTLLRHSKITLILIAIPVGNLLTEYYVFHGIPRSDIGFINNEGQDCQIKPMTFNETHKLGCDFFHHLSATGYVDLLQHQRAENASQNVHLGKSNGYIVIPDNFTEHVYDRAVYGKFSNGETLDGSSIQLYLDYSNFIRNSFLIEGIISSFKNLVQQKINDSLSNGNVKEFVSSISSGAIEPIKFHSLFPHIEKYSDSSFAVTLTSACFIIPTIVSITMVWDKKRGAFQRTLISGAKLWHMVVASFITYVLLINTISIIEVLACSQILGIPINGHFIDIFIIGWGQGLIGLAFGFFLGLCFSQEVEVIFCILFFYMITILTEGGISPIESVQSWFQWFVISLPLKLSSTSVKHIIYKGWTLAHPKVWPCFIVTGGWLGIFTTLAIIHQFRNEF